MQPLTDYITDEVLHRIKQNVLRQKPNAEVKFRAQIKQAIRKEIDSEEMRELATIFDVSIEDIANYVAGSFVQDAMKLSKLLSISIDDAMLKIRGLK